MLRESWSLTLREECRLRAFEQRILRRIFGPKRDGNGECRRLYNELHSLYRSPNIVRVIKSRRLKWAGLVTRMEEDESAFKILTGKPKLKGQTMKFLVVEPSELPILIPVGPKYSPHSYLPPFWLDDLPISIF